MTEKIILKVERNEEGPLVVDLMTQGFTSLEVIGILEQVKHSYLAKNETTKNEKAGDNSDDF